MLSNIKNIIFDIGGVLVDLDKDRCVAEFTRIGFPQAAELIDFYHPAEFFNKLERGEISVGECCDIVRQMAGNESITNEQIGGAYSAFLLGIPVEKLRLIRSLREAGYKIYALSNINALVIDRIYEFFESDGFDKDYYFDKMYLSFEMKSLKPDREIFDMVIAHSGVEPSQTLFIDDSLHNVNMGREVGFEIYMPAPKEDFSHIFDGVLAK
ncbi:MAG: HAD family phosphatase [Rikenellaceae bacterium]